MGMLDFEQMDLSLVSVGNFSVPGLYCLDDSPLQNQDLFPGCYGICANPDVSGIGNRISLYIQTILTLWLATLTPHADDTLGAMLAAIAASFTVFVATLAQYAYNNITFHHTLITINLSNLPTVAFFAGILRLRLQPGIIPLGPKLFATPILILQLIACGVSVFLGVGLNASLGGSLNSSQSGRGGSGGWNVAQPQCNPETQVIVFGKSVRFWQSQSVGELANMSTAERAVILTVYGMIIFLPFLSSFICLYAPETGTLRAFASAFHQEKRTNKFALFAFFVLSNIWVGILIYATELQIMRNKVLPGENTWGSGQILAMLLVMIPLLGCLKILIQEVGNHSISARRWIKRSKLHRIFGVRYDSKSPSIPGTPVTPRASISKGDADSKDIETGLKSPKSVSSRGSRVQSPVPKSPGSPNQGMSGRRLSKRGPDSSYFDNFEKFASPRPDEQIIVVPGEDSGPEDAPGSARRPPMYESRQATLVNGNGTWKEEAMKRRKSNASIASQSVRSRSGSVKIIVKPDGQMTRVLSRRSSLVGEGSHSRDRERDREEEEERRSSRPTARRRLSKQRPDSRDIARSSSARSRSEDGYWSAAEEINQSDRMNRRPSAAGNTQTRSYSREEDNDDGGTIRRNARDEIYADHERGRQSASSDRSKNDDPLSKYHWDPQRGWLERK